MNTNLLITLRGFSSLAQVLEGLVLVELGHHKGSRVLPLGIPIVLVKLNSMVIVSWDFIAILVAWCRAVQLELGLVDHAEELLVLLGNPLKPFPTIKIEEVILFGINCAGDRVISSNDGEGFLSNLPILPFDHDIVLGALVSWVRGLERTFMSCDAAKFPHFGSIIILLPNIIEDLVVC